MMQMAELLNRTKKQQHLFYNFSQVFTIPKLQFSSIQNNLSLCQPSFSDTRIIKNKIGTRILGKHSNKQTTRSNVNMV